MPVDFEMYAADTRQIAIDITDENGTAVDVSAASDIRYGIFSVGGVQKLLKSLTDGVTVQTSVVTVALEPEDSADLQGEYVHELEIALDAEIFTALHGTILIHRGYINAV